MYADHWATSLDLGHRTAEGLAVSARHARLRTDAERRRQRLSPSAAPRQPFSSAGSHRRIAAVLEWSRALLGHQAANA